MKTQILLSLILLSMAVSAQPFEKTYPYLTNVFTDDVEVNENGFTLAGFGKVNNQVRLVLIHTDASGDTLHVEYPDAVIPGNGSPDGCMITTSYGCHYVAVPDGETANLIKFSPAWTEQWRIKNDSLNRIKAFCETSDGNLLVSGIPDGATLTKIDTNGRILWQSEIPNGWLYPATKSLLETRSGEILLGMYYPSSYPGGVSYNNTFYTFSSTGAMVGTATLSPDAQNTSIAGITIPLEDHFVSICSFKENKPRLVRHLSDGTILSQKELNLPFISYGFRKMILNNNNELVATGTGFTSNSAPASSFIYGMSTEGDSLWLNIRQYEQEFIPSNIVLCSDGGYIISGAEENSNTYTYHPKMIRTDPWGGNSPMAIGSKEQQDDLHVYPNPAVDKVVFESREPLSGTLLITDLSGRRISEQPVTGTKTAWFTGKTAPGIYLYCISGSDKTFTGRLVVVE